MLPFTDYAKFFISLLAIVDPLGAIPLVLVLTAHQTAIKKQATLRLTVISVLAVLLVSLLLGEWILWLLGISIDAFRCAGGLILLLMSIAMLQSHKGSAPEQIMEDESVALVPLTMPLLAGPGAISTIIVYAHQAHGFLHYGLIICAITLVCFVLWLTLLAMPWLAKHLTPKSISMSTRVMGILLAAIAIEFMAKGLKGLFPLLA